MFLCIVPTWMFDIFILDAAGMKIHLAGIKPVARKIGLSSSYVDVWNMETAGMKTCSGERMGINFVSRKHLNLAKNT